MGKNFIIALKVSLFMLLLCGIIYPFIVTGISSLLFYKKAQGSFILNDQQTRIGSELIGQNFTNPTYFHPRPSLAGKGYDGMASGGSNLGPTSKKLREQIQARVTQIKKDNPEPIPIDLVTASGSGLDPHISPQAAYWQASRIAMTRHVSLERIFSIIDELTEPPQFHIFGNARINVLKLNLVLDQYLEAQENY